MRITPGTVVIGIFAVLAGLVGTFAVKQYLQPPETVATPPPRPPSMVGLPYASTDLGVGKTIRFGDIKILNMTAEEARTKFPQGQAMANAQQIIGRVVREPIKKDDPFFVDRLYPEGTGP